MTMPPPLTAGYLRDLLADVPNDHQVLLVIDPASPYERAGYATAAITGGQVELVAEAGQP